MKTKAYKYIKTCAVYSFYSKNKKAPPEFCKKTFQTNKQRKETCCLECSRELGYIRGYRRRPNIKQWKIDNANNRRLIILKTLIGKIATAEYVATYITRRYPNIDSVKPARILEDFRKLAAEGYVKITEFWDQLEDRKAYKRYLASLTAKGEKRARSVSL